MLSATPSIIKKKKDLFKKIDTLFNKTPEKFINWLKDIPINYTDGKISSLFNSSTKIQIETISPDGQYNIILLWIMENTDKFKPYTMLLNDIPSSNFTTIEDIIKKIGPSSNKRSPSQIENLNMEEALKKWKENPNVNPYNGNVIKISIVPTSEYGLLYETFCKYLTYNQESHILPIEFEKEIRKKLPDNHIYAFKDIDYIENIKSLYPDEEWINFLDSKKNLFYKNENVNDVIGSTVYDFLFMHFFLIKNTKKFDKNVVIYYIDNQLFLYETILAQIKHIKAVDLNCYEIFESMVYIGSDIGIQKGDNFKLIKKKKYGNEWPYDIPPLLKLFTEYINEITYYILPISNLRKVIYNKFFLYGENKPETREEIYNLINETINYNIYRLKTILNIIFSSLYTNGSDGVSERININEFLNIFFYNISECIGERNAWYKKNNIYEVSERKLVEINNILAYSKYDPNHISYDENFKLIEYDIKYYKIDENIFKMFIVSSIFDIKTLHDESSETNNTKYEFIKDPYDNLPDPPVLPILQMNMPKSIDGTNNSQQKKALEEYKKKQEGFKNELKNYDIKIKEYNDKYLDKKLSPYFSVKLSRAKSEINEKNSLRLSYTPLKISRNSLTNFKSKNNKENNLIEKFEKQQYSRTSKRETENQKKNLDTNGEQKKEKFIELNKDLDTDFLTSRNQNFGNSSKKKLSKSDLKLKLALEADKFKTFARSLSPSGKSPKQKYIECDLSDYDPITQVAFSDMHFKKIKYLSKIKTILPNGKIITNCYDTVPLYNYILDCNNKGEEPQNLAQGREPFDILHLDEVYKKIKYFTKKPTLQRNIDTSHKIFLKTLYVQPEMRLLYGFPYYIIFAKIMIGSVSWQITHDNNISWVGGMLQILQAPVISSDDILFEDTSDNTTLLIEKGVENGSLLKVNKYPYWHKEGFLFMPNPLNDLLQLPSFSWSSNDNFDQLKERTHVLNNRIERLI